MNRLFVAGVFLGLVLVAGCSKSGPTTPALAPVKGKVNLDGKAMPGGEIRFGVPGQPVKTIPVQDGAFQGEVFVGANVVEVVFEKDGPPHPMDPKTRLKVNTVAAKYSGPNSVLKQNVEASGATDLKFDVTTR